MSYYQMQLDSKQVQEILIDEFNKALSQFPQVELIPVELNVWEHNVDLAMKQLFRADGNYYFATLCTQVENKHQEKSGGALVEIYSRQIQVRKLERFKLQDIFENREKYVGVVSDEDIVYEGRKIYCCPQPSCVRNILNGWSMENFEQNIWYFDDITIPDKIMEKIVTRYEISKGYDGKIVFMMKLKKTPFKGFKKDVVYKRFYNGSWSLTNRNGREATEYDLIK